MSAGRPNALDAARCAALTGLVLAATTPLALAQQATTRPALSGVTTPAAPAVDDSPIPGASTAATDPTAPLPAGKANYGKPRKQPDPVLKYPGLPKQARRPLPPLQTYPTAPIGRQRRGTAATVPDPWAAPPPVNYAQPPQIPGKAKPVVDADPFGPTGVMVGSLRLVPYVEADGGYENNPLRLSTGAKGSTVLRGEAGFTANSLWSTNDFKADFHGGYSDYANAPDASRPDATGRANLRLDMTRETALDFEIRGTLSTQRPGSPELNASVKGRPMVLTSGATGGVTETLGRTVLGLHGTIDRTNYEDATLSSGTKILLSNGNYSTYGVQAKAGYEIAPGIVPYVEIDADTRVHDQAVDLSGYRRDSTGQTGKIGTTFEISRVLTGMVAAGYTQRQYSDARLAKLTGPTFESALVWAASPLTTLTLRGSTDVAETTVATASGSLSRKLSLEVAHALLKNLTLGAVASVQDTSYQGISLNDTTYTGTLSAQYNLNRWLVLKGSYTYEQLHSNVAGSNYNASAVMFGIKLQR